MEEKKRKENKIFIRKVLDKIFRKFLVKFWECFFKTCSGYIHKTSQSQIFLGICVSHTFVLKEILINYSESLKKLFLREKSLKFSRYCSFA